MFWFGDEHFCFWVGGVVTSMSFTGYFYVRVKEEFDKKKMGMKMNVLVNYLFYIREFSPNVFTHFSLPVCKNEENLG